MSEKFQITPEYLLNTNLSIHQHQDKIYYATTTHLVELFNENQKIFPLSHIISNISYFGDLVGILSQPDGKLIIYQLDTMRKRRVIKEEQGVLEGIFVNASQYAIITEKKHLRVYLWEKTQLLVDIALDLNAPLNLFAFQEHLFVQNMAVNMKEKCLQPEKELDSIIQHSPIGLLTNDGIFIAPWQFLSIKADLLNSIGCTILNQFLFIAYPQCIVICEKKQDYIPLKQIDFQLGHISQIISKSNAILLSTTNGGIYEFNYDSNPQDMFKCILNPTISNKIICSATVQRKPWIVFATDKSLCLFNYLNRSVQFTKPCLETCTSLAIHPSSLYLIATFPERTTIYEILHNDFLVFKDVQLRWCRNVQICRGGHLFALVVNNLIQLYDFWLCQPICVFKGHQSNIVNLQFDDKDMFLFSTGNDGSLYTWNLITKQRENDLVLKGSTPLQSIWLNDSNCIVLQVDRTLKEVVNNAVANSIHLPVPCLNMAFIKTISSFLVNGNDGKSYIYKYPFTNQPPMILSGHSHPIINCQILFNSGKFLTICDHLFMNLWNITGIEYFEPVFTDEIVVTKDELDAQYSLLEDLKTKTEEKKMEIQYQIQVKKSLNEKKINDLMKQHSKELEMLQYEHDLEMKTCLEQEQKIKDEIAMEDELFNKSKLEMETHYQQLLNYEYEKQNKLRLEMEQMKQEYDLQVQHYEKECQLEIQKETDALNQLKSELAHEFDVKQAQLEMKQLELNKMEHIQDEELTEAQLKLKLEFDEKNKLLDEERFKIQADYQHVLKQCEQLEKEIHLQDQDIHKLEKEESDMVEELKQLQADYNKHQQELSQIDAEINNKDDKISDLKQKQQELEKYKFVMDYKLQELQDQVTPKKQEIQQIQEMIEKVKQDEIKKSNDISNLNQQIHDIQVKISLEQQELQVQQSKYHKLELFEKRILFKFKQMANITNKKEIKLKLHELSHEFEMIDDLPMHLVSENEEQLLLKQRDQLQKQIQLTQSRISKHEQSHQQQMSKLLQENMVLVKQIKESQVKMDE
eukprot:NODE_737_length_4335_cov_0.521719.p1 type:complete len:1030 gc:universal NODE_737_length_4335_cov_0.521719:169-3258(+)